jgi:16S rRNA U516 pseudouridylate synthase RsuA-like enzyme
VLRTRIGSVKIRNLEIGKLRPLLRQEVAALLS